jgi:hypothetical protein
MKSAQDFVIEIPVLKNNDQITKARQILRDDRFREVYVVDGKKPSSAISTSRTGCG